jgi:predicted metal-dependent HD superfamily phosphohydrolase
MTAGVRVTPERWNDLWRRVGAATEPGPIFAALAERYGEPHRAYHTLAHVARCLWEFDHARLLADHADEVELALWFHDAIYDPHAADNEVRSAAWAVRFLEQGGVAHETRERVAELINATDHRASPAPGDTALVVDVDLTILGAPEEEFDAYERQIRREYAFLPEDAFRAGRRGVLERLLARPRLYTTALFHARYETAARANLARSLARLMP